MVLTDDNFATIVVAIEAGRQVYDNVRKFIQYIFAHATPEVLPFLVFALARRRDPAAADRDCSSSPSTSAPRRCPRWRSAATRSSRAAWSVRHGRARRASSSRPMLVRAWLFLGVMVSALSLAGFFYVLHRRRLAHRRPRRRRPPAASRLPAGDDDDVRRDDRRADRHGVRRPNQTCLAAIGRRLQQPLPAAGRSRGSCALAAVFVYAPPLQSLLGNCGAPAATTCCSWPLPLHRLGRR